MPFVWLQRRGERRARARILVSKNKNKYIKGSTTFWMTAAGASSHYLDVGEENAPCNANKKSSGAKGMYVGFLFVLSARAAPAP